MVEYQDQCDLQKEEFIWDSSPAGRILKRQGGMAARGQNRKRRDPSFHHSKLRGSWIWEKASTQCHVQWLTSTRQAALPPQRAPAGDLVFKYLDHWGLFLFKPPHTYSHSIYMHLKEISVFFYVLFFLEISFTTPLCLLLFSHFVFSFPKIFPCFFIVKHKEFLIAGRWEILVLFQALQECQCHWFCYFWFLEVFIYLDSAQMVSCHVHSGDRT